MKPQISFPNYVRMSTRVLLMLSHFLWKADALKSCSDALYIFYTVVGLLRMSSKKSACGSDKLSHKLVLFSRIKGLKGSTVAISDALFIFFCFPFLYFPNEIDTFSFFTFDKSTNDSYFPTIPSMFPFFPNGSCTFPYFSTP